MDPHFDGVIFQIHAAELARRIESWPTPQILDVRSESAFTSECLPGARRIRVEEVENFDLDLGAEIVIVGNDYGDEQVRPVSLALMARGARRVVELTGGMHEWALDGSARTQQS